MGQVLHGSARSRPHILERWRLGGGSQMSYIEDLKDVIRKRHGVESTHLESVPVTETFNGKTVWDGIVEVFQLHSDTKADTAYAWSHSSDDQANPIHHITVLHLDMVRPCMTCLIPRKKLSKYAQS
jgi:hypothetical protein